MPLNFAIVGLKLIGIYLMAASIPLFATTGLTVTYLSQIAPGASPLQISAVTAALIPSGTQMLLGILLFTLSESLGRKLAPSKGTGTNKNSFSIEDLQTIAFAAVGILIIAIALPDLARVLQNLYYWCSSQHPGAQGGFNWIYSVGVVMQFLLGLMLLLSPQGFRNIWRSLRTAGTGPKE